MLLHFSNLPPRLNQFLSSHSLLRQGKKLLLSSLLTSAFMLPVEAAEKIHFQYGLVMRSLEIQSIEDFAMEGTISDDLDFYLQQLDVPDADRHLYREHLLTPIQIDAVLLNRFLHSRLGEEMLTEMGRVIRTASGLNGKFALRAAITLAAQESGGLTPLNILRQAPTDLKIDLGDIQALHAMIQTIIDGTIEATDDIKHLSNQEIAAQTRAIDYAGLPDLRMPGRLSVRQSRLELYDAGRDRRFYVEIYQPDQWRSGKTPVVIFSHGLGDSPQAFHAEAQHLASYGFLVALPQHPGSDSVQQEAFKSGTTGEIYQISEFVDRPQDITYLLDELESRNATEFESRLDLQNVGMGGHSFGGYTALALAGATIDFENLARDCQQQFRALNLSLFLQCHALDLPPQPYDFRDDRITSIVIKNPVNSSIFGPKGLAQVQVPVMMLAGSHDPVTPAVYEQFRTFRWFTTEPRYLVLMEGQAHFDISALDIGTTQILDLVKGLDLASPEQLDHYSKTLAVSFFQTFTARRTDYQLYLRAAYADYLSQEQPFKIYLVSEDSSDQVSSL
jgi:predicted dienelactone hydrolase